MTTNAYFKYHDNNLFSLPTKIVFHNFIGYDRAFEPVNELLLQLLAEYESDAVRTEAEGACAD